MHNYLPPIPVYTTDMNILITGANGYIGQRLIPVLLQQGHTLYCCVRDITRFEPEQGMGSIIPLEIDFLKPKPSFHFPENIDVAYYLIHSMSTGKDFEEKEFGYNNLFIKTDRSNNM